MAFSVDTKIATGTNNIFTFTFSGLGRGYLDPSHIHVFIDDVEQTFVLDGTSQLIVDGPVIPAGTEVVIRRITPKPVPVVDWKDIGYARADLMDRQDEQLLYISHEFLDGYGLEAVNVDIDMQGHQLLNVYTDINDPASLATIGALGTYRDDSAASAAAAALSESAAAASASAAAASAADSAASAVLSDASADAAAGTLADVQALQAAFEQLKADTIAAIAGAAIPVGMEFMWFADPADPLGDIPAGFLLQAGQELSRTTYPAFWDWLVGTGRVVSEATWQAAYAANDGNVGFYSSGDGSTTFRMARLMRYVSGGEIAEAGGYLGDAIRNITGGLAGILRLATATQPTGAFTGPTSGVGLSAATGSGPAVTGFDASLVVPTAAENRPKTIKRTAIVKAFSAPVNEGVVDVTALASDVVSLTAYTQGGLATRLDTSRMAQFADVKAKNVDGGSCTPGAWNARALNTTVQNTIPGCVLNGDASVSLPAGRYYVEASAPCWSGNSHMLAIRKVGDSTATGFLKTGQNAHANSTQNHATVSGVIELTSAGAIYVSHWIASNAGAGQALGVQMSASSDKDSRYAELKIWRIS